MKGLRALSVASELFPLIKTGGLGDVAGALPRTLAPLGAEVRSLVPGYPAILEQIGSAQVLHEFKDLFGGAARLLGTAASDGLDVIVIDAPHLYRRAGNIYTAPDGTDWPDNAERFAALSWVAAEIGLGLLAEIGRAHV